MSLLIFCISEDKGVISWSGTVKDEILEYCINSKKMPKIYMPGTSGLHPQHSVEDLPYGCRLGTIWRLKPLPVKETWQNFWGLGGVLFLEILMSFFIDENSGIRWLRDESW